MVKQCSKSQDGKVSAFICSSLVAGRCLLAAQLRHGFLTVPRLQSKVSCSWWLPLGLAAALSQTSQDRPSTSLH